MNGIQSALRLEIPFAYPTGVLPPWAFAVSVLQAKDIYPWQAECLEAVGQGLPTALLAANGSGKTRHIIAPLLLWFLFSFPKGVAKVTSGSWQQITEQLVPALDAHRPRFEPLGWKWLQGFIESPAGGFISVFSTDRPGRAEGFHGTEGAPLFYVIDEAKSVDDGIFAASDRCTAQYRLIASSPAGPGGRLYDCFNRLKSFYYGIRVTSVECPHITESTRQRDREMWGESDAWYRSRHLAEFADDETMPRIVSPSWLRACYAESPAFVQGRRKAFCDFAAGGAENVIALAEGNRVFIAAAWTESDTVQAARQFKREFERLQLNQGEVYGDDGGLGHVMIDQIAELGYHVKRVNNELPASDPEHFANLGSEMWFQAARRIEKREVILPEDKTLFDQLVGRRRDYDHKGRLIAESKKKMAARGLASPDRADAICGAMYNPSSGAITAEMLRGMSVESNPFVGSEDFSFEINYE